MRHSIPKAVQLVHGIPREAASHLTYGLLGAGLVIGSVVADYSLSSRDKLRCVMVSHVFNG
jgi:hypothetical protein